MPTERDHRVSASESERRAVLLCRVRAYVCALPLEHVIETMRPRPVEPIAGAPSCVAGLALIRGMPVPVVDAARLLTGLESTAARYVTLRVAQRVVALAVDEVVGVRALPLVDADAAHELAPLLAAAQRDVLSEIRVLDAELLLVLGTAHVLPEGAWADLPRADT